MLMRLFGRYDQTLFMKPSSQEHEVGKLEEYVFYRGNPCSWNQHHRGDGSIALSNIYLTSIIVRGSQVPP